MALFIPLEVVQETPEVFQNYLSLAFPWPIDKQPHKPVLGHLRKENCLFGGFIGDSVGEAEASFED